MQSKRYGTMLIGLLLTIVCLAACRGTQTVTPTPTATRIPPTQTPRPTPTPTPTPSPQELLQAAFDASQQVSSYRYEMDVFELLSGSDLEEDIKVSFYLAGNFQSPDRTQGTMSISLAGTETTSELIVIGETGYIKNPATGRWQVQGQTELPFNPDELMIDATDIQELQLLEQTTIDGVPVYHLSGHATMPLTLEEPFGEVEVGMQVEYWISQEDNLPLQSVAEGQVKMMTQGYSITVDITVSMRLFDYNVPLEIAAPQISSSSQSPIGILLPPLVADDAQSHLELGLLSFEDDRPGLAAAHFTRAIELQPEMIGAYVYRGLAWLVLEAYKFPSDFDQVIAARPDDAQAYFLRALSYTYGSGIAYIDSDTCAHNARAWELEPGFAEAQVLQASCICSDPQAGPERLAQAFALLAQARELDARGVDPFYATAPLVCFDYLNDAGEVAQIEQYLPQIDADIAAHPELPGGYFLRAEAILWLRDTTIEQTVGAWTDFFRFLQRVDCPVGSQMRFGFERNDILAAARQHGYAEACISVDQAFDQILDDQVDLSGVDALMASDAQFKAQFEELQREAQLYSIYAPIPERLSSVTQVVLLSSGDIVATYTDDIDAAQFWSLDGESQGNYPFMEWYSAARFSPDGRLLATGGDDGQVQLWEVAHLSASQDLAPVPLLELEFPQQLIGDSSYPKYAVESVAFSPDGSLVGAALRTDDIQVWSAQSGEMLYTLELEEDIEEIALSAQGHWIAVVYGDAAAIFDLETGEQLFVLVEPGSDEAPFGFFHYVTISPDGKLIAAAGRVNTDVTVWDSATGELVYTLGGHPSGGGPLAFSPDSRLLAVGGGDGVVRVWDMNSGQLVLWVGHRSGNPASTYSSQVSSVAFSADGRTLLTGGEDGTARLWDVQTGAELAIIRVVKPESNE